MYDFVVVGGGSAGYAAARTAGELGLRTAVIDGAEELGGLCILRGCMPSKAVIESANRARTLRRAEEFGLRAGRVEVKPEEIIRRKRALVDDFAGYRRGQLEDGRFELIRGRATYESHDRIRIRLRNGGERVIGARTSLVATGSVVSVPEVPGLDTAGYWTSDEVLEATRLPESVIVLGGGAIALEMAHYLSSLGVTVTVVQRSPGLLRTVDAEIGEELRAAMERRGIRVICGTALSRVEVVGGRKRVIFSRDGWEEQVEGDEILAALGRRPAVVGLGLEQAGVAVEKGRILVGPDQETSRSGVFAAGDVSSPLEVVHLAIEQGEVAAWNAGVRLGKTAGTVRETDYRLKLFGVFSDPQVAVVGASEEELAGSGRACLVARQRFDDHGMSMVKGETDGFVKVCADPGTGEILGAAAVGPEAVELIHEMVVAMRFRATVGQLRKIPHYHPSLSEIWTYPAEELADRVEGGI